MSLQFFRADAARVAPVPYRLWSAKLNGPLLACVLQDWQCLWVHYVVDRQRTALHEREECPYCAQGKQAQKRGYAAALLMRGTVTGSLSPVRWGNVWSPGVIELPGESIGQVVPGWPSVWLCERLTKSNGLVRCVPQRAHVPLPPVVKVWDIEPTIRRAFGVNDVTVGGAK